MLYKSYCTITVDIISFAYWNNLFWTVCGVQPGDKDHREGEGDGRSPRVHQRHWAGAALATQRHHQRGRRGGRTTHGAARGLTLHVRPLL